MVLSCNFCSEKGHVVDACPHANSSIATIQTIVENANLLDNGQPLLCTPFGSLPNFVKVDIKTAKPEHWPILDIVTIEKNKYEGRLTVDGVTKTIQLWSGRIGLVHRTPAIFIGSVEFVITYGTAMFCRPSGEPGNYDAIPDRRGPCILIEEIDEADRTMAYVQVETVECTVGTGQPGEWAFDFQPL